MRIRRFLIVLAALALTAAGCGNDDSNGAETGDTGTATTGDDGNGDDATDDEAVEDASATLYLDFFVDGLHAPFFVADEKGYFEDERLSIDIQPGQGSADALRVVASGRAEFGLVDAGTFVKGVSEGAEATAVGVLLRQMPGTTVVRADSDIEDPADLAGRSVGDAQQASTAVLLPAFLAANGVEEGDVQFVGMGFPARVPSLLEGQVDAIGGYAQEFVGILDEARLFNWYEYGIDAYGTVVVVNNAFLEENPDVVERFMRAAALGLEDTFADPQEAAELTATAGDGDAEYFAGELELLDLFFEDDEGRGFQMSESRWEATQQLMLDFGEQAEEVPLDQLFTNDYVQE
jgi:NitT/TauT family transport system substrate-binding protein